jgi:hypothetical protein
MQVGLFCPMTPTEARGVIKAASRKGGSTAQILVLGHDRGCFNTGLHTMAPQRSEHVANEPVATAKVA